MLLYKLRKKFEFVIEIFISVLAIYVVIFFGYINNNKEVLFLYNITSFLYFLGLSLVIFDVAISEISITKYKVIENNIILRNKFIRWISYPLKIYSFINVYNKCYPKYYDFIYLTSVWLIFLYGYISIKNSCVFYSAYSEVKYFNDIKRRKKNLVYENPYKVKHYIIKTYGGVEKIEEIS